MLWLQYFRSELFTLAPTKSCCSSGIEHLTIGKKIAFLLILAICCYPKNSVAAYANTVCTFNIKSTNLPDALELFSAQAGLQVLYEQDLVQSKRRISLHDNLPIGKALDALLRGSGLSWRFVNINTVAIAKPTHVVAQNDDEA